MSFCVAQTMIARSAKHAAVAHASLEQPLAAAAAQAIPAGRHKLACKVPALRNALAMKIVVVEANVVVVFVVLPGISEVAKPNPFNQKHYKIRFKLIVSKPSLAE